MTAIVRSEREFTQHDWARIASYQGRPQGRVAGGHLDDLASLKKAIWLCPGTSGCARKFNAKGYEYGRNPRMPVVRGRCDGCNQFHPGCVLFIPVSEWRDVALFA